MPGSMFSPKMKIMSHEMTDYAPDTKRIDIEQLHDGTFVCRGSDGHKFSYKNLTGLIKGIKENFCSEDDDSEEVED